MEIETDLENLRKACEMQVNSNEIIITSLDACKFKASHISVKEAPKSGNNDLPIPDFPEVREEKSPVDFSKENDIPDLMSVKVYDFVMSKDRTLPGNVPEVTERQLRRKWLWICGLGLSSLVLLIIIVLIIFMHPGPSRAPSGNHIMN